MKNKGFTLIEILVTIFILAAVSVTIGVSFSGMAERQNAKEWDEYKSKIESAACVYAESKNINSNQNVKINVLIEAGLVRKEWTNPKTERSVTEEGNNIVRIIWNSGEKKCEYNPS